MTKPLKPAEATKAINDTARNPDGPGIHLVLHCKERLAERSLLMGDLMHLLKFGFVLDPGYESTRPGSFKYNIEGTTPNSDKRVVKAVVIPDFKGNLKVVTIMWKDE